MFFTWYSRDTKISASGDTNVVGPADYCTIFVIVNISLSSALNSGVSTHVLSMIIQHCSGSILLHPAKISGCLPYYTQSYRNRQRSFADWSCCLSGEKFLKRKWQDLIFRDHITLESIIRATHGKYSYPLSWFYWQFSVVLKNDVQRFTLLSVWANCWEYISAKIPEVFLLGNGDLSWREPPNMNN